MKDSDKFLDEAKRVCDRWKMFARPPEPSLQDLIANALRAVHDRAYENAEKFLLEHYWDSIEDKKDLLNLHIKACFRHLRKDDK